MINGLASPLVQLANYGAIRTGSPIALWLQSVGAAQGSSTDEWLCADRHWLRTGVLAKDEVDLVRRTAIRDPLYRFHVDAMLAEIVETVGRGSRWQRLEELLFGPLIHFSPRFVQLIQLAKGLDNGAVDWTRLRIEFESGWDTAFRDWDRFLWADTPGGAAALFPLLLDLYMPIFSIPMNVDADRNDLPWVSAQLLAGLIRCAKAGECQLITSEFREGLDSLYKLGVPVRCWRPEGTSPDRRTRAGLAGPVRLVWRDADREVNLDGSVVLPVDRAQLEHSSVDKASDAMCYAPEADFWSQYDSRSFVVAFSGLSPTGTWPAHSTEAPSAIALPRSEEFAGLGLSRKRSPEVDSSLRKLADHLMFGPLLQLLVMESLDRELGQETVTFVVSSDCASEVGVKVFYRPTPESRPNGDRKERTAYGLGDFETVMQDLSAVLRIEGSKGMIVSGRGGWTSALFALEQVGMISFSKTRDRCYLSLEALDRLHGGELMPRIIRKGQGVRDSFRIRLNELWAEIQTSEGIETTEHVK